MKHIKIYLGLIIFLFLQQGYAQQVMTLDQCVQLAIENNKELQNSKLEADAARQVKKAAFTKYFPQINAGGLMFQSNKDLLNVEVEGGNLPVYDGNPANLMHPTQFAYFPGIDMSLLEKGTVGYVTAIQPLFTGGRIINGNKLASLGRDAAEFKSSMVKNDIVLQTEEQYWQIVSLNEKSKTIEKYIALLQSLLDQVNDAYNAGVVMKNDVLKVKLEMNRVLLLQSKLDNGKQLANMAFCRHLGIPMDSSLVLNDPLVVSDTPQEYYVDKYTTLTNRDEYNLLNLSVKAAKLQTRMKIGESLPTLGVGVSGMYYQIDDMDSEDFGMAFGMVSVPISGWWSGCHEIQERKAKQHIAENNFNEKSQLLLLQMEKAWQDFTDSYKQYQLSMTASEQAAENMKVNQDSYDNGLVTVSDLLEAQALLQEAEDQLTNAKAHYLTSKTRYLQVTGR